MNILFFVSWLTLLVPSLPYWHYVPLTRSKNSITIPGATSTLMIFIPFLWLQISGGRLGNYKEKKRIISKAWELFGFVIDVFSWYGFFSPECDKKKSPFAVSIFHLMPNWHAANRPSPVDYHLREITMCSACNIPPMLWLRSLGWSNLSFSLIVMDCLIFYAYSNDCAIQNSLHPQGLVVASLCTNILIHWDCCFFIFFSGLKF